MQVLVISMPKAIILAAKAKRRMLAKENVEVIASVENARRKSSLEGFTLGDKGFRDREKDISRKGKKAPKEHNQELVSFARSWAIGQANIL